MLYSTLLCNNNFQHEITLQYILLWRSLVTSARSNTSENRNKHWDKDITVTGEKLTNNVRIWESISQNLVVTPVFAFRWDKRLFEINNNNKQQQTTYNKQQQTTTQQHNNNTTTYNKQQTTNNKQQTTTTTTTTTTTNHNNKPQYLLFPVKNQRWCIPNIATPSTATATTNTTKSLVNSAALRGSRVKKTLPIKRDSNFRFTVILFPTVLFPTVLFPLLLCHNFTPWHFCSRQSFSWHFCSHTILFPDTFVLEFTTFEKFLFPS